MAIPVGRSCAVAGAVYTDPIYGLRVSGSPAGLRNQMAVTEKQVIEALSAIIDPDRGGDIVSLGMVSGVAIRDSNVAFSIEVEPERGPRLEPLRKAAERAVDALPGVLSVTAVLTAQTPARGRTAAQPAPQTPAPGAGRPGAAAANRPQRGAIPGV